MHLSDLARKKHCFLTKSSIVCAISRQNFTRESLEAPFCTAIHSIKAYSLTCAIMAAVVDLATYLEGSVAEFSV